MPTQKKPRCPYCILEARFREMRVLENSRQICGQCGHIICPEDPAFCCPCQKCVEVHFLLKNARATRATVIKKSPTSSARGEVPSDAGE